VRSNFVASASDVTRSDVAPRAITSSVVPYPTWRSTSRTSAPSPPLLDAVFIPTQAHRRPPATELTLLRKHARHVVLLFSDGLAEWAADSECQAHDDLSRFDADAYDSLPTARPPSRLLMPEYDIPAKRTYALQLARQAGWEHIGLLDDDIGLTSRDLTRARRALAEGIRVASFHVLECPDVSTVDHLERMITGATSHVALGGNCLFLRVNSARTHFPPVYNDDWLFLFAHRDAGEVVSLGTASQRDYRPWLTKGRAAFEQFGDVLIEGLKENVTANRRLLKPPLRGWDAVLDSYRRRLERLRAAASDPAHKSCLDEASDAANQISPNDLGRYLDSFRSTVRTSYA
jgi:hypothetical protein